MTTKERIVEEALTLFSTKGFKGTSVKNIADSVGIKDSSLYKHYKSKQEIFDTIVTKMQERIDDLAKNMGLPEGEDFVRAVEVYGRLSEEELVELSKNVFLFYLQDDFVSRFWRMANIEQYQNVEIYNIFRHIFMEESINYQTALFTEMVHQGIFVEVDPAIMAINFYSPIFFLLSKFTGREEGVEQALEVLERQVKEFYRIYKKK